MEGYLKLKWTAKLKWTTKSAMICLLIGMVVQLSFADVSTPHSTWNFPSTTPEASGFSVPRLERMTLKIDQTLKEKKIPGAVAMIIRDGRVVYEQVFGNQRSDENKPMATDSIFRIYSMTKPIVSVAAMMQWEEGAFQLWHPVHWYLPELKDLKVAMMDETGDEILQLVPPTRPITIQDLFRHTAGFTYGIFGVKNAVRKTYLESGIEQFPFPGTNQDFLTAIAKLPLLYQPGEKWGYSHATHVLGRLVEVIDGKPLGQVLRQRILAPLGMDDTDFWVPPEKHERIVEGKGTINGALSSWLKVTEPMEFESAGGGLVSTVPDYARFCQMMLNGGVLEGKRIISPRTVELMTADHLGTNIDKGDLFFPGPGQGFGLGFQVRLSQGLAGAAGSPGQYSWSGIGGTAFWIDPQQELILIYMMQDMTNRALLRGIFQTMAYAAMTNDKPHN